VPILFQGEYHNRRIPRMKTYWRKNQAPPHGATEPGKTMVRRLVLSTG
jgi:hypothetical protein